MVRLALALLACAAGAQDDDVAREAVLGYVHAWDGFGAGSRIVFREISKRDRFNEVTQKVEYEDQAVESTWTVRKVVGDTAILNLRSGLTESDVPFPLVLPASFRGRGERLPPVEIPVGDRRYRCAVSAMTLAAGEGLRQVATIWKSPEAPGWAVRWTAETYQGGVKNTSEEELLVAVNQKMVVGGRELRCHVVQVTTEAVGKRKSVKKEWRAEQVPGRVVRRETRFFEGDREVTMAATTMEVVSFDLKR